MAMGVDVGEILGWGEIKLRQGLISATLEVKEECTRGEETNKNW